MVLGGFTPWATVLFISVNGTQGDGWFLIVAGALAGVLAYTARRSRWAGVSALLAGVVGVGVTAYDLSHLEHAISHSGPFGSVVHVGWGLVVGLIASISMGFAGLVALVQGSGQAEAPVATAPPVVTDAPVPADSSLGKICPDCAEEVQKAARICRFCGHQFEDGEAPVAPSVS
jgi:hypothetical protein